MWEKLPARGDQSVLGTKMGKLRYDMNGKVRELKERLGGEIPGESNEHKKRDLTEEQRGGKREGSEHHGSFLLEAEGTRVHDSPFDPSVTAADIAQGSPPTGQAKGSATSLVLGMDINDSKGVVPASKVSGGSWDADDTPRLDDYFRGQASVPPSEGQLLPPPFDGGANGSPLFPSPPLEGRALYGLSTWSFGSDLGGGSSGDDVVNDAALQPSALNYRGPKPTPAESFSYHDGRAKADVKIAAKGDHRHHYHHPRASSFCADASCVNGSAGVPASNATATRGNPLPRRGSRFLVEKSHNRNQQPKRAADVGEEQDETGGNITNLNGSVDVSNHDSGNQTYNVGGVGTSSSITSGPRRRSNGNGGGGGHQKRHQEWLDKFGEDKRIERQEEEAKVQRREAARRRTRDLLLERAKQRLLAIAAAASTATASALNSCDAATSGSGGVGPSPQGESGCPFDRRGDGIQVGTPSVAGKSSDGDDTKGDGIPLYAQETWAARRSKVERKESEADLTPEEKRRLEKEKFERIAATRRRQKENHKRFLAALKAKRVREEEERLLQERKLAEKKCNIKMWAERRLQKIQKASGEHCPSTEAVFTRKNPEGGCGDAGEDGGSDAGNNGVAGSGLNAIREAHCPIENGCIFVPSSAAATSKLTTSEEIEKEARVAEGLEKEERRRRSSEIKLAREKAQRHLESLVQKKREKEDEEANAKRRQAKRTKLLRNKVLSMAKELRQSEKAAESTQRPGLGAESGEDERSPGVNNSTNNGHHMDGGTIASTKAPSRLTDEELQASVERLTQQRKGGGVVTASARDFNDWKRKHRVAPETKVFVMTGWYPCVKEALIERGWVQNTDRDSPFFDLKWTLHSQDIRTTDIEPWQLCNHFFKNVAITTKAGLLGNLRNLKWFADCDCGDILPRGYDLSVETDVLAFLDDYCATAAESLLKHVLLRAKGRVALRRVGSSTSSAQQQDSHGVLDAADGKRDEEGQEGKDDGDDEFDDSSDSSEEELEQGEEPDEPYKEVTRPSSSIIAMNTRTFSPLRDGAPRHEETSAFPKSAEGARGLTAVTTAATTAAALVVPPMALTCSAVERRAAGDQTVHLAAAVASSTLTTVPKLSVAAGVSTLNGRAEGSPRDQQQQREENRQHQTSGVVEVPPATHHTAEIVAVTPQALLTSTAAAPHTIVGDGKGNDIASTGEQGSATQVASGARGEGVRRRRSGKARKEMLPVSARRRQWEPEGAGIHVNVEILGAALAVCRRRHAAVGHGEGELDAAGPGEVLCTELEWELIGLGTGGGAPHPDMPGLYRPHFLPSRPATPLDAFIQTQPPEKDAPSSRGAREERRRLKQQEDTRAASAERVGTIVPLGGALLEQVEAVLERAATSSPSQFDLNGDFCQNMWIVKPAAKSRGRGIECFTELDKLLSYTESKQPQAVSQWVVHKYIENPLIIARRKFDMRQWVLVTDWNPLTIWFYDRCYVRFGVEEYTTSGSNIGNSFVHLVNNSICKKSDNFGQVSTTDNGVEVHEHMWSNEVFKAYVDDVAGEGCWRKKMQPRMEQIVTWSLLCAQAWANDLVEHRKNSWELYGYDFMVDDQYKPWLIEINSSPACDYSTKVTEQYVQAALTDLLKVTVDLPAWEANHKKSSRASQPQQKSQQQQPAGISARAVATDGIVGTKEEQEEVPPRSLGVAMATPTQTEKGKRDTASSQPGADRSSTSGGKHEGSRITPGTNSADVSVVYGEKKAPGDGSHTEAERGEEENPPDTGLWRLLYKGAFVPFPVASFGTDLALKGTHISNSKHRARSSPHTVKM
ncbi:unnamed protein product [Scytosiphon promiscuus]